LTKIVQLVIVIIIVSLLTGCTNNMLIPAITFHENYPSEKIKGISIALDEGSIIIKENDKSNVIGVESDVDISKWIKITNTNGMDQFSLDFKNQTNPPKLLQIALPTGISLLINSFEGKIEIENISSGIQIESVASPISLNNVSGIVKVKDERGDINILNSTGVLDIVGIHGFFNFINCHGLISSNTILGKLMYTGTITENDEIVFETDHGPVVINLSDKSNVTLSGHSTNGEVISTLPDMKINFRDVLGQVGKGVGKIRLLTVSGSITLQPLGQPMKSGKP
jgi:hypothetical protein